MLDGHARPLAELGKNPFADVVSVEYFKKHWAAEPYSIIDNDDKFKEFDGMSLETVQRGTVGPDGAVDAWDEETVEVTVRVPEQFFTTTYLKSDWEKALAAPEGSWDGVEYLTDTWRSDIDIEDELYGPDGQQVPLW